MAEAMETRELLSIDLSFTAGPSPGPYGVAFQSNAGATSTYGQSVAIVGDVNGDGYQDTLVGSPQQNSVQLIFGSNPTNFLQLTNAQRAVNAGSLTPTGTPVSGLTFTGGGSGGSSTGFGTSVAPAGDVNGDGLADFLIGSPNAMDGTNSFTAGRAYLVYGTSAFKSTSTPSSISISQASNFNINTVTFTNSLPNSSTGSAVSTAGKIFQENRPAVAIGANKATLGAFAANGGVYVIPNSVITSSGGTVDLSRIGQPTNGLSGIVFAGSASNGLSGSSIGATDFDNDGITDLVVGSPGSSTATLIYGTSTLLSKNQALSTQANSTYGILQSRVPSQIAGINFQGNFDSTGAAVAFGGDFNGDGNYDLLIGSPNYGGSNNIPSNAGMATVLYGTKGSANRYTGSPSMTNLPAQLGNAQFIGDVANALVGTSVSTAGYMNTDNYSEILLGAPGTSGAGRAFLMPGNPGLYGPVSLNGAETNPYLNAVVLTTSSTNGTLVGTSVSGYFNSSTTTKTVDSDNLADIVIGAPRGSLGGVAYLTQGAYITIATPQPNIITTQIGVDALPTSPQPYRVSATTPANMDIYVLSQTTTPSGGSFAPLTDIVASSVVVNGVAYPGAQLLPTSPADINGDGIPDAIVEITPRSNLNLKNGSGTLTINGLTTANLRWTGSASIYVVGGSGPTPGPNPMAGGVSYSADYKQTYNPPVNGEASVPTSKALSKVYWKPLSYRLAYNQFLPNTYYQMRTGIAFNTASPSNVQAVINQRRNLNNHGNPVVNHRSVFMRGKTYAGMKLHSSKPTIPPIA